MESSLSIRVTRIDRTYRPNDMVEGYVLVNAKKGWKHLGLRLLSQGDVQMTTDFRHGFNSSIAPTVIFKEMIELVKPGSFLPGETKVPFSFKLTTPMNMNFIESYHGAHINVIYSIKVSCERGLTYKPLFNEMEFVMELPAKQQSKNKAATDEPILINISPSTLSGVPQSSLEQLSNFNITGKLHRTNNPISQPLTGELVINRADVPIRSIDIQLGRKEKITTNGVNFSGATEVQCIQIADGNVPLNVVIPIYMIYPRLFTCPTYTDNEAFKIEWQIAVVTSFVDGFIVSEKFDISLFR